MSNAPKVLISLASLAFLLAVLGHLFWPDSRIMAEALSRASKKLALIAIALLLAFRADTSPT